MPRTRMPYLRALVHQRGEAIVEEIRRFHGRSWDDALALLRSPNPEKAVVSTAGFGSLLTEFLIAPGNPGDATRRSAAARRGAHVNLIVSLYDNLIDQGYPPQDVLPATFANGPIPLIPAMARQYVGSIWDHPHRSSILKAIAIMRDAQDRIASEGNVLFWRRKSALPWVVMALGGESSSVGRLSWVYRCGCFFGWLDDAMDTVNDAATGRFNRVNAQSPAMANIANLGGRVLEWWDERCRNNDARDAFRYCVSSWVDSRQP